jgi:hypothetical protein
MFIVFGYIPLGYIDSTSLVKICAYFVGFIVNLGNSISSFFQKDEL